MLDLKDKNNYLSDSNKRTILLLFMSMMWGLHFVFIKSLTEELTATTLITPTLFGILIVMSAFLTAGDKIKVKNSLFDKRNLFFYAIASLLGYIVPLVLEVIVAESLESSLLTLIVTLTPLLTMIISVMLKIERATLSRCLSFICGFMGLIFLFFEVDLQKNVKITGCSLAFLIPLSYAVYNLYVAKKMPRDLTPFQVAITETIVAILLTLPFFMASINERVFFHLINHMWDFIVLVIVTAIEVICFFELVKRSGAIYVSYVNFMTLIFGYVFGNLFFNEKIDLYKVVSITLMLSSLLFITMGNGVDKLKIRREER